MSKIKLQQLDNNGKKTEVFVSLKEEQARALLGRSVRWIEIKEPKPKTKSNE